MGGPLKQSITAVALTACALFAAACGRSAPAGGAIEVSRVLGEPGSSPGQLAYARAIAADLDPSGSGRLVVIDKSARIQILDAETGDLIDGWRTPARELGKPVGITIGPHPTKPAERALWVGDTHYHRVLVYEFREPPSDRFEFEPREPILSFGEFGRDPGQFIYVTDVAVLPSGDPASPVARVYVGEYGDNDRVTVFEPTGDPKRPFEPAFEFGSFGSEPGTPGRRDGIGFIRPQAVELDLARRELLISDAVNHRLGRFTLDGELIAWIDGTAGFLDAGATPPALRYPYGMTVLEDGEILLAEFGGGRIRHLDLDSGETLGIYGEPGRGDGQLASPWGVEAIGREAFALDSASGRVLVFESPGRALRARAGSDVVSR
ncbi:MAG: hypothetical protein AAFR38_02440 [Planctomycetota bacterium]